MDNRIVDEAKAKYEAQSTGLKLLLALLAVAVVGTVLCIILAVLRVAVQAVVITAGVLIVVGLICAVSINGLKYKAEVSRYKHDLERHQQ